MLLLFAFYANLRWTNEAPAFEKAKQTADTPAYVRISGEAFLSKDFWASTRPPMFPLVLKIYNADFMEVAAFHAAFSIFAWGMLALAVAYAFKGFLRPFAFGLILALSLDRHIAGWDVVMLTESISISLMAIFIAAWLWLLRGWSWGKVFLLSLVAFLWAFTRDTNGWILLMIAGLIVAGHALFQHAQTIPFDCYRVCICSLYSAISALDRGNRWVFPFQNVLAQRILTDQEALAFFADCGMPVTPELLEMADGYAGSSDRAFYKEPALESYRVWLHADGKSCYMRWLLSRPMASLRQPWLDLEWLLAFEDVSSFIHSGMSLYCPGMRNMCCIPDCGFVAMDIDSIAALIAILKKAWKTNPAWIVFIGLCLLIYPHLFIVWHGDVPGTHRHALTVSLQFGLGLWLFGLLFLEAILIRFRVRGFVN